MPHAPLRSSEIERAAHIAEHLSRIAPKHLSQLQQPLCDVADILGAHDAGIALASPRPGQPPADFWFRDLSANALERAVRGADTHPLALQFNPSAPTRTIDDQGPEIAARIRNSAYYRAAKSVSGFDRILYSQLTGPRGESLGRLIFPRRSGAEDFDPDRVQLLATLRAAFSKAVAHLLSRRMVSEDRMSVALLDAAGHVIWMTEGFRFMWNVAEAVRFDYGKLSLPAMIDGGYLARATALQVTLLSHPLDAPEPPIAFFPSRAGDEAEVEARFEALPGAPLGCRGRALRMTLRVRAEHEWSASPASPASPASAERTD